MANDSTYLMSGDELVKMRSEPYESEDLLQVLLAQHPDLLAAARWIATSRGVGFSCDESWGCPARRAKQAGSAWTTFHRPRRHPHPRRGQALD